jgi:diadenosine tetraphosphate (Ap4A) HIT family hydrolase
MPLNALTSVEFELHPNFSSKIFIADLPLCKVLLENDRHYPWLMLIPRRPTIAKIMDLSPEDQLLFLRELDIAQNIIWHEFQPTQINVAALGNKTPQLHVHIIARFKNDPAWPATVWDHPVREKYSPEGLIEMREILQKCFQMQHC